MDDTRLLWEFVSSGSERAFASLVARHVDLVYSAAMRQVHDRHAAEDVAQTVFLALARQARGLRKETVLSAWLLITTRHAALDLLKAQGRRKRHEMKAAQMTSEPQQPEPEADWQTMAPHLDAALASLNAAERRVIALRYFEDRDFEEVAFQLGVTPQAARQRAHRATLRMRKYFSKLGVEVPSAALGPAIIAHAVAGSPPGLSTSIASTALAGKAAVVGILGTKGAALIMASAKLKILVVAAVLLIFAGGAVVWRAAAKRDRPMAGPGASSDSAPAGWQESFNQAYRLQSGQVLALIAPPYIPERQLFWRSQNRPGPVGVLQPNEGLTIGWTSVPRLVSMSYVNEGPNSVNNTLRQALAAANITPREIDGSVPMQLTFAGDWVFQQGATADQIMAALGPIVSARLGRPVHFEKRRVTAVPFDHQPPASGQWCLCDGGGGAIPRTD